MKYPKFLKDGGTIGFAAPSFGAFIEPYHTLLGSTVKSLNEKGFKTLLGPNAYEGSGIGISNTPELCAKELEDMYEASDNDVIISVGGGELMCETLGALNLDRVAAAAPKWFMGYSDNTNFGFVLATMLDTASIYGPNSSEFGMEKWHEDCYDSIDLLCGKKLSFHGYDKWEIEGFDTDINPLAYYNLTEDTRLKFFGWDASPISGRFAGGCLDVLANLCGTRFDKVKEFSEKYKEDGIVWFLEACDLSPTSIRRALWELDNAGWFNHVKAFVFGRPYRIAEGMDYVGVDEYSAAHAILDKYNVPIIMDADIGHHPPMIPIINGGYGTITPYGDSNIQINFELK